MYGFLDVASQMMLKVGKAIMGYYMLNASIYFRNTCLWHKRKLVAPHLPRYRIRSRETLLVFARDMSFIGVTRYEECGWYN